MVRGAYLVENYEKLGAFYLGRQYDPQKRQLRDELVLYDSKDLTTHAVIIGMTGSGKTGLGISLLEEALIDRIPVIAIDPKGDLPNLLLTFPELRPRDFQPWVNPQEAVTQGLKLDAYAAKQAQLWRDGLAQWGQSPQRIARLRQGAEFAVYTPGSDAGRPVSLLRSFDPPQVGPDQDRDLWRERIQTTASSLLALAGLEVDPLTSREHILIANILETTWAQGRGLDLAGLIRLIQEPPFQRLGVMELEAFYPAQERFGLSLRLNNLLAAPGFETWLEGDPLDMGRLLHGPQGQPRASIFTISHLSDAERMFFVTMLLNQVIGWMRGQPGTSSLRAILYMDEVMGYLPPVKNPPSKQPLLMLLKQARAFGLGVVLATQNPVDLDYKALSNAGTWFIGRMQTERDKQRVLEGLEGAAAGGAFDRAATGEIIAGLGKRTFLLNNVHESHPQVFQVRWALSYLRGPMTRDQIRQLEGNREPAPPEAAAPAAFPPPPPPASPALPSPAPPLAPAGVAVRYLPASGAGMGISYYPALLGCLRVHYASPKQNLGLSRKMALAAQLEEDSRLPDWEEALELALELEELAEHPLSGAGFADLPAVAARAASFKAWEKDLVRWVRQNRPLVLLSSSRLKLTSQPGESEGDFRARLGQALREERDLAVEKLRRKYEARFTTLRNRQLRAQQAVSREAEQAKASQFDAVVNIGATLLGAFLGRKVVSSTSVTRAGTAIRSARRSQREKMDVARAQQTLEAVGQEMAELQARLDQDISRLEQSLDPAAEELRQIAITAKSTDISLEFLGLAWLPFRRDASGGLSPDWKG